MRGAPLAAVIAGENYRISAAGSKNDIAVMVLAGDIVN
jgi:hypothetical protein